MFKRAGHVLLMVALLNATGLHWAVLQSVAWATMLANHARTESLAVAVSETFDGKHPCPLCRQIAKSRQNQNQPDLQTSPQKLEFPNEPAVCFICPPAQFSLLSGRNFSAALLIQPPPTPPPRETAV